MKDVDVSIIVVNYNGLHHLKACMPSLVKTEGVSFEIIVVDNGSEDDSILWLKKNFPRARVIEAKKNLGFGRANEVGIESAKGEMVAFLNNDTQVDPQWLVTLFDLMSENREITAACSRLMLMEHPEILNGLGGGMSRLGYGYDHFFGFSGDHQATLPIAQKQSAPVLFPTAAAMLISKRAFRDVGGFDKSIFMYHEDVDLGWRIWLAGGEVHVCSDSIVYHSFGGTTSVEHGNGWRDRLGMRHNVRSILKCYRKKNVISVLGTHARLWIRRRAWGEMAHVVWWNLLRLPGTLLERSKIQKTRILSDEEFLTRGLISCSDYPGMSPLIPLCTREKLTQYTVKSPSLNMGDATSLGRIGAGWYMVENLDGKRVRWNSGQSICWLKVKPYGSGTLKLNLFLSGPSPDGAEVAWANVACGVSERRFEFEGHSGWHELEIDAQADSEGIIEIQILSSTWSPHTVFNNGDVRTLGCAVERIEFEPIQEPEKPSVPLDDMDCSSLSVIIPTYNRKAVLKEALGTLKKQTLQGFQVIVVDDGSTDGTLDALKEWEKREGAHSNFDLEFIGQENQKQGQARNNGLKSATGDIIMFIGDDILLEPDCLEVHMRMHGKMNRDGNIAVLGFTDWDRKSMKVSPFLEFINGFGAQFGYKLMTPGEEVPFTCFYTSHISMHRSVLVDDPFDPCFKEYGWEDIDLGYRLSLQGAKIVYIPEAGARHQHPTDMPSFMKRQNNVGFALETLLKMHPELRHNMYMPTFTRPSPWTYLLVSPVWHLFIRCMDFLDKKGDREFSSAVYHWLVAHSFHTGWGERLSGKK